MSLSANKLETETVANGYAQRANILLQPDSSLTKTKSFFYKATLHKNKEIFQSSTSTQKRRVKKKQLPSKCGALLEAITFEENQMFEPDWTDFDKCKVDFLSKWDGNVAKGILASFDRIDWACGTGNLSITCPWLLDKGVLLAWQS